jgi:Tol biopolymer transport system component
MNQVGWERAKSLLADAAELPPADRERFVAEHCPDPELRREVLELLAAPAALSRIVATNALQPGARLGPYVIERLLGIGGMGEVYKARDTVLDRTVAIKVLPDLFADDAMRLARFRREAQLVAALNHPNIAHIHGFEESTGVSALVMELVEGPTLGERIARRPLPLPEALSIARQIADALEAAHDRGIVHRDLKPANIKVREDGTVKVLDFGLAKALDRTPASNADSWSSPTLPARGTEPGIILGTAAYMAPEQALGKAVDKRADIWSFGCVLYEMLTARKAFDGSEPSDTLSLVITKDPDWTALPPNTPTPIRKLLRRCLDKDRNRRLADIADARFDIEEALSPSSGIIARDRVAPVAGWRRVLPWAVVAMFGTALAVVVGFGSPWRTVPVSAPLRLSADLGAGAAIVTVGTGSALAISLDGTQLAFVAHNGPDETPRLYVRRLDHLQAMLLPDTDGAEAPFFSPDGEWLAFFAAGKLKKISVTGGAAITLCDAPNGRGGAWGEDGTIVFAPDRQTHLVRVSSSGGAPAPLTTLDTGEVTQRWPQILPGGKAVLFTSLSPSGDFNFEKANLVVQSLPAGARKVVLRGGFYGRYVPAGHLVYLHNGALFAATFDPVRLEMTSTPLPAIEGVVTNLTGGAGLFAASSSGALVYMSSGVGHDSPIEWLDRSGRSSSLRAAPSDWENLRFAPDGRRLAFDIFDGTQWDVWVDDWARDTMNRLTSSAGHSMHPVWTPDGNRIVFASMRGERGDYNLYWQRVDGTGDVQRLTNSTNQQSPGSWHPSGRLLAYEEQTPANFSLMLLPMDGDEAAGWKPGTSTVFLRSTFSLSSPTFSPDGRWLAYQSRQSGQDEVYVRPFPGPGSQWKISTGGGLFPRWSRTRHELLYGINQRVMAAAYSVDGDAFHAEQPRAWPDARFVRRQDGPFDLHPDGDRLALATLRDTQPGTTLDRMVFVLNFFDELRQITSATKR